MAMPLTLVTVPCLSDNYAFLLHDDDSGSTALIDVPEAEPIAKELSDRGWRLTEVWLTHHHDDHIQGVPELLHDHPAARVTGAAADAHRLPAIDRAVAEGDTFHFAAHEVRVLDVSGHTIGHVAFHLPSEKLAFTGDSLMALGCGRLFEGTPAQMFASLGKFADMPGETKICSGHEYTASNARFAMTVEAGNPALTARADAIERARAEGKPTVPSTLEEERATNPFLRSDSTEIRAELELEDASDVEVFTAVRKRKDAF